MIKLTGKQVTDLYNNELLEGYEGWSIEYDQSSGDFDSNYLFDFEIDLYDENDLLRGTAIGGTYSDCEVFFVEDFEFKEPTDLSNFNRYLIEIANNAMSVGSELAQITAKLTEISQFAKKLTQEK